MVKIRENIDSGEMENVRREWLDEKGQWYFSIVDVVGLIADSSDARNYWKVLKNRLKNTQKELVTECNQLKMKANDGKSYLTDVANERVMLEIINIISPSNSSHFRRYFDRLEKPNKESYPHDAENFESTDDDEDGKLPIDGCETEDEIIITSVIAGISVEKILVSITCDTITIKGERNKEKNISTDNYLKQELYWGKFSRFIILPAEIEIESAVATLDRGILEIKLKKINKLFKKVVEIKLVKNI